MSFKPGPEDCYGRCGSDKIWQTIPDTCSGDRKSSVTDDKESGAADNQWWRWTGTESLTSLDICHLTKLYVHVTACGGWMVWTVCSSESSPPVIDTDCMYHSCHCCLLASVSVSVCSVGHFWRQKNILGCKIRVVKTVRFLYPVNLSRKRPVNRRTVIYLLERRFYTSGSRSW